YERDVVVGHEGLASPDTRVASYSDWAVTADWRSGGSRLRATMGHGMPFVYFERKGTAPLVVKVAHLIRDPKDDWKDMEVPVETEMWSENGAVLGITVAGHD